MLDEIETKFNLGATINALMFWIGVATAAVSLIVAFVTFASLPPYFGPATRLAAMLPGLSGALGGLVLILTTCVVRAVFKIAADVAALRRKAAGERRDG